MSHRFSLIAASVLLTALAALPVQAAPRLFGDSVLFQQNGFSDEITGQGPDLVLVASAPSDSWKAVIRHLRGQYRVHLIVLDDAAAADNAAMVDAWLVRRGWTPVLLAGDATALAAAHPEHVKKVIALQGTPDNMIAALDASLKG